MANPKYIKQLTLSLTTAVAAGAVKIPVPAGTLAKFPELGLDSTFANGAFIPMTFANANDEVIQEEVRITGKMTSDSDGLPIDRATARAWPVGSRFNNRDTAADKNQLIANQLILKQSILSADVVVYGATFSGIMAAVSAKKNGASVLLIEPRDDIGGMVTGGIMYTDSMWTSKLRSAITGLTNEFYAGLGREYGYDQQTYFQAQNYSAESKKARAAIDRLLQKWNIPVYQMAKLTAITKVGTVIKTATFDTIGTVTGTQFIDSTYTGDLMAMAGCTWTIGREAASKYSESTWNAGITIPADVQSPVAIDPYIVPGDATSGLIPFVQSTTLGAAGTADGNVMAMGFRLAVTNNASNKVPFPLPSNYNPAMYELHRRNMLANGQAWTTMDSVFLFQPVLPSSEYAGSKWDINNKRFIGLDYVNPFENTEYATASWERRAQIDEKIKQYTLGLMYFYANDPSVPAALRASVASYGLCADEYQSTGGFPKYPYCREARRMVGDTVVRGIDITTLNNTSVPVAQAYYLIDSHPVQYVVQSGKIIQEGVLVSNAAAASGAKISRSILFPKATECTNLQVTWCGSMSHIAFASIRMEPIAGCMGEGAGLIAAMAIRTGLSVQTVPGVEINRALNLYGWSDPGALTISSDNTSYQDGSCVTAGTWTPAVTTVFNTASLLSCSATSGTNTVTFTPSTTKIQNGFYDVYLKWIDSNSTTRGSPTVTVTANGVSSSLVVTQSTSGEGGDWYYAGRYFFRKGSAATNNVVIIHDNTTNPTNMAGVKFVPVKP